MPVAAPADKRFRRAHVTPTRRRAWRERWPTLVRAVVIVVIVIVGGWKLTDVALHSDAVTVTRISVDGTSRMSRGEVLSLVDDLHGMNMLTVNLDVWRERLLASPWVADAALRREFPGTIVVMISERQPLGIARIGERLYLLDQRGGIIDEYGPNYADLDLPIIDGLASASPADPSNLDAPRAALVSRLLTDLHRRPALAQRVSQIDVTDLRDAIVVLKGDTALVRVGDDHFAERLQAYLDMAPALKERIPDIDYVDLRFDQRVYVRPLGGGARAEKASARNDS
jgi:cell division protein FtsQ